MKFEKIIIPPGWKDSFTKYPNGRTIFEALSHTITTVNEGIDEVNEKVNQGIVAIDQAENTIRNEITDSFNTLKLELESEIGDLSADLLSQWASFQLSVNAQLAEKANQATTYNKTEVDNALTLKADKQQEAWITPTLLNGATAYVSVAYMKDQFGFVHFKGAFINPPLGVPLFNMPVGYTATERVFFPLVGGSVAGRGAVSGNSFQIDVGTSIVGIGHISYKGV